LNLLRIRKTLSATPTKGEKPPLESPLLRLRRCFPESRSLAARKKVFRYPSRFAAPKARLYLEGGQKATPARKKRPVCHVFLLSLKTKAANAYVSRCFLRGSEAGRIAENPKSATSEQSGKHRKSHAGALAGQIGQNP
jgi:hypothetical protein